MADLFLTWDEAQGEQLPHYCVSCAAPATEWADWRICKSQNRIFSIHYTYVDVTLPVCPQHRTMSWIFLRRVVVREIRDDGVVVGHVSPGFVEAVWDYRDEQESQPPPSPIRRVASGPRSRQSDFDEDDDDRLPRRRPRQDRYAPTPSGWTPGKIILLVFIVLLLAPCALVPLLMLLAGMLRAFV